MPETYSQIQQQYPLSPKKFWKKIIEKTLVLFIVLILIAGVIGLIVDAASQKPNHNWLAGTALGILIGLLIYFVLLFLPYALYVRAYIRRYYYDLNADFITIKKGVFAPTEIHVQYTKIQDVYVDQDILDRIMGLYDVHIASATVTSGMEAHIDGVDHEAAEGLKNLLLSKIKNQATNPTATQQNVQSSPTINLTQKISSNEYPIQGRWLFSMIGKSVSTVIILILVGSLRAITNLFIPEGTTTTSTSTQTDEFGIYFWLAFLIIGAVGNIIYWAIWRSNYYFEYQPEYILEKTQVLARSEKHVPYRNIQNVTVTQGIVERILGICTVTIENAAQGGSSKLAIPGQTLDRGNALVSVTNGITSQIKNASVSGL
jgi:putative membrane protein